MRSYTPGEVRSAVVLAVFVTAIVAIALLDPSCRREPGGPHDGPARSVSPR